ncbi:endo-1,4-beta-xylanase [Fortiea contorta]|uniref:endo-1,4-beta-xylanase n=1 Tax=Fortiea contorta TaxID=1892405 RepID=UPI00036CC397|nr:endo-1,4-beta-xylanase [Fortiea contorta]
MVRYRIINRRNFLFYLGSLTSTFLYNCTNKFDNPVYAQFNPKRNFSVINNAALRKISNVKGLVYGAHPGAELTKDQQLQLSTSKECGILVAGFYAVETRPTSSTFNFAETDFFAKFASQNSMLLRGHPLVWYQANPKWLTDKFNNPKTTSKEIQNILSNHVSTIVKRYAGKIHSWDVLNEAIEPNDGRQDGLRVTPWLKFLGPDYIDLAFRLAAKNDPKALLVYNDYGIEHDTPEDEAKRAAVLKLLKHLKSKGTPIHALGIQSHLAPDKKFNFTKLRKFLKDVANLGLKIMVTELDVVDKDLPANIDERDRIIASVYEDYLSTVLQEPAVIAVITWGLTDKYTWLSWESPRADGKPVRPLPLDSNFQRKFAWNAISRVFDKALKR